ncbi:MAG: hypothetical protein H7A47_03500 [Verrucomicrobiales bacterium]|nr:hypothetical protein [Verrucomicrobiales bacterium]
MRSHFPLTELCDALAVSRSGYHASRRRQPGPRARQQVVLLQAIDKVRAHRHARCYGSPRMTHQLRRQGHQVSESMSARGHCYDNAMAESVFAALKAEALPPEQPFASRALARSALFDYLETWSSPEKVDRRGAGFC